MRPYAAALPTLAYIALTLVLMLVWRDGMEAWRQMLWWRAGVVAFIAVAACIYRRWPGRWTDILRTFPLILALVQWYPELYGFCSQLPYQDHLFARADQWLCGCQPALRFAAQCPSAFVSELMCLGYYSYYYLMGAVILAYFLTDYRQAGRAVFVFLTCFFLFYLLFIFIPVAGPQYYFAAVDPSSPSLPAVQTFAADAPCIEIDAQGFFGNLVVGAQQLGERPEAAFPSSHVGMTLVVLRLAWQLPRKHLFFILLPFAIVLTAATVYIKAHYLVDVLGAFLLTPLIYLLAARLYRLLP